MQISDWRTLPNWVSHSEHWYVLSDTHGRLKPFCELIASVPSGARIMHLGDIGDRGPDSLGCYRILAGLPEATLVRGNHDMFVWQALFQQGIPLHMRKDIEEVWWNNHGDAFMHDIVTPPEEQGEKRALLKSVLLRQKLYHRDGNLFFMHSGLHYSDDFGALAQKEWLTENDIQDEIPKHLSWRGEGNKFWNCTDETEWKGFPTKPFIIHGHRRCEPIHADESPWPNVMSRPREDGWRIGVDCKGMQALEIYDGKYRFYWVEARYEAYDWSTCYKIPESIIPECFRGQS